MRGRALVIGLLLLSGRAWADGAEDAARAKELAREGARIGTEGLGKPADPRDDDRAKLEQAVALYKQAFTLDPSPEYQCSVGSAYAALGELARAHAFFSQCLVRLPAVKPDAVEPFRRRLADVEAKLRKSHVAVDVAITPAGAGFAVSSFAADEELTSPTLVWLPPGHHTITAHAPGRVAASQDVDIAATDVGRGQRTQVRLTLEVEPTVEVPPVEPVEPPKEPVEPARVEAMPAPEPKLAPAPKSHRLGWIIGGAGAVAVVGGAVMHGIAYGTRDDLAGRSGDAYDDLLPTFERERAAAIGLYAVGAVGLGVGAWLVFGDREERGEVAIVPRGDGAVVTFGWSR